MTTLAVCSPARLKALLGETQVMLVAAHTGEADANGVYRTPGSVRSQWISSDTTVTPCRDARWPIVASVDADQTVPVGF